MVYYTIMRLVYADHHISPFEGGGGMLYESKT